jgi:hypothetical protein
MLKHPRRYDDPWTYDNEEYIRRPHASKAKQKPVLVYDAKLLTMTDYVSFNEAARSLSVDAAQICQSARNAWYIGKRFICGYSIQQLFDNMEKHGLT